MGYSTGDLLADLNKLPPLNGHDSKNEISKPWE
jgi:hypothetical protein